MEMSSDDLAETLAMNEFDSQSAGGTDFWADESDDRGGAGRDRYSPSIDGGSAGEKTARTVPVSTQAFHPPPADFASQLQMIGGGGNGSTPAPPPSFSGGTNQSPGDIPSHLYLQPQWQGQHNRFFAMSGGQPPPATSTPTEGNLPLPDLAAAAHQAVAVASVTPVPSAPVARLSPDQFPPFVLFDAPCELRCNFIGAQRNLGVPVKPRTNDLHYGLVVNGFHPQLNAKENPPQLVDGRYASRSGSARNEREQKRAQRITDLIETLRRSMIDDGWSVELGSKYVTLASCTTYIQHLLKDVADKEERNKSLRARVREHENAQGKAKGGKNKKRQRPKDGSPPSSPRESVSPAGSTEDGLSGGSSSDEAPESVNSSLTSASSSSDGKDSKGRGMRGRASMSSLSHGSGVNTAPKGKKARTTQASPVSGESSPEGSTDGTSPSEGSDTPFDDASPPSSESGSSEAAGDDGAGTASGPEVGSGEDTDKADCSEVLSSRPDSKETDGAGPQPEKNAPPTLNSLDPDFVLDYGEVFDSSNVPQMIANFSGRIMAWNNFFSVATGLSDDEARKNTIFSLVRSDRLSNLFEIVAGVLRHGNSSGPRKVATPDTQPPAPPPVFRTITVPCIGFADGCMQFTDEAPLYMTVNFLGADEPRERCFHCAFANAPPALGGLFGRITPDLLAGLSKGRRNLAGAVETAA